jgi:hypothetical protein
VLFFYDVSNPLLNADENAPNDTLVEVMLPIPCCINKPSQQERE